MAQWSSSLHASAQCHQCGRSTRSATDVRRSGQLEASGSAHLVLHQPSVRQRTSESILARISTLKGNRLEQGVALRGSTTGKHCSHPVHRSLHLQIVPHSHLLHLAEGPRSLTHLPNQHSGKPRIIRRLYPNVVLCIQGLSRCSEEEQRGGAARGCSEGSFAPCSCGPIAMPGAGPAGRL